MVLEFVGVGHFIGKLATVGAGSVIDRGVMVGTIVHSGARQANVPRQPTQRQPR